VDEIAADPVQRLIRARPASSPPWASPGAGLPAAASVRLTAAGVSPFPML
jgi:hypothetical protein